MTTTMTSWRRKICETGVCGFFAVFFCVHCRFYLLERHQHVEILSECQFSMPSLVLYSYKEKGIEVEGERRLKQKFQRHEHMETHVTRSVHWFLYLYKTNSNNIVRALFQGPQGPSMDHFGTYVLTYVLTYLLTYLLTYARTSHLP